VTRVRRRVLPASFFARPAFAVAPDLLGRVLCRRLGRDVVRLPILETEAYHDVCDLASHAARGRTPRNDVMFGPAGRWYVYLCYGVHWMLNVVTADVGTPSAVLVRATAGLGSPGVLTRELRIDRELGGRRAAPASGLWIEEGARAGLAARRLPRVGVAYAGPVWAGKPWRFLAVTSTAARGGPRTGAGAPSTASPGRSARRRRPSRRA
jgi:DNA-3-methyladenine glycosylase